jgi:integrase
MLKRIESAQESPEGAKPPKAKPKKVERFSFTKTDIAKLPLPVAGKRATYYDVTVPKLALRVTAAGTRTFYTVRRGDDGMDWLKLGVFPDMTVENARKEAETKLGLYARGDNPAAVKRAAKEEQTLDEYFKHFIENKRKKNGALLSPKTKGEYKSQFAKYLAPIAKKKISKVSNSDVKPLVRAIGKAHPVMANRVRALVSSIYGLANEDGLATGNPAAGVSKYGETVRDRFLHADELPRFFASVGQETNSTVRDFFLLSLLTGARRANVLAMRWNQIRLDEGIWRIPNTKNGTPQNVTLSPEAAAILTTRKETADGAFVFPGDGKSGHLMEPKKGWQRIFDRDELAQLTARIEAADKAFAAVEGEALTDALERARKAAKRLKLDTEGTRIDPLRIHDLRRTLGSWQAKQGASLAIIGKSLNHKSQQATAIYARLDLDPVRASVNQATAAMMEAGGMKKSADVKPIRKARA